MWGEAGCTSGWLLYGGLVGNRGVASFPYSAHWQFWGYSCSLVDLRGGTIAWVVVAQQGGLHSYIAHLTHVELVGQMGFGAILDFHNKNLILTSFIP